jgi:glyoxylase-like metal-dependent hydrolase (beta-lactamase superfamily II)
VALSLSLSGWRYRIEETSKMITLTFHGAAGCVTGFCALLATDQGRFLIDCGMFQGPKTLRALNHKPFPFDAATIDGVLLTHAHIDHSGLLPKLVRAGFRGSIFATRATRDLCEVMLADSADIQQGDVDHLNRRNERRGIPKVQPIYGPEDVAPTLALFQTVKFGDWVEVRHDLRVRYWPAGHLLGAASIELEVGDRAETVRLLFSGDLGSGEQPYLVRPDGPKGVDHVILESTYGDRVRDDMDLPHRRALLADEMRKARAAGGPLLMPTFAVGRAQELILDPHLPRLSAGDRGDRGISAPGLEQPGVREPLSGASRRASLAYSVAAPGQRRPRATEGLAHHPGRKRDVRRRAYPQAPQTTPVATGNYRPDHRLPGGGVVGAHPSGASFDGQDSGRGRAGPRPHTGTGRLFWPCRCGVAR